MVRGESFSGSNALVLVGFWLWWLRRWRRRGDNDTKEQETKADDALGRGRRRRRMVLWWPDCKFNEKEVLRWATVILGNGAYV